MSAFDKKNDEAVNNSALVFPEIVLNKGRVSGFNLNQSRNR